MWKLPGISRRELHSSSDRPPGWIEEMAVRVDELIGDRRMREHWQRQLKTWDEERRKKGGKVFEILPRRALTLPEKYTLLAAIHDVYCEKVKRIDPWRRSKRFKSVAAAKRGLPYEALQTNLKRDLRPKHRRRVERILAEVEADCGAVVALKPDADRAIQGTLPTRQTPQDAGDKTNRRISKGAPKAKRTKRQRRNVRPLTEGQQTAWKLYQEHRSYTKVAEIMVCSRPNATKLVKRATGKINNVNREAAPSGKSVRTKPLSKDHRGQPTVADNL